jgi:hypothetical protein
VTQPGFFDPPAAIAARDEAVARVGGNAPDEWKRSAMDAVRFCARMRVTFTADDVWARLADATTTHEPRALGAVMTAAHHAGVIVPTGEYRPSDRPEAHRRPMRVWKSA